MFGQIQGLGWAVAVAQPPNRNSAQALAEPLEQGALVPLPERLVLVTASDTLIREMVVPDVQLKIQASVPEQNRRP